MFFFGLLVFLSSMCRLIFSRFDLISPRNMDVIYSTSCDETMCDYLCVVGVFVETDENSKFSIAVNSTMIRIYPYTLARNHNYSLVRILETFSVPKSQYLFSLDVECVVNNVIVDNFHVNIILSQELWNVVDIFNFQSWPNELLGSRLDYLEIGTSNFGTCIQQAELLIKQDPNMKVRGISIEPLVYYIQQLPKVEGTLRLNIAVVPISLNKPFGYIFYLSEPIIDQLAVNWSHLKGCSMIDNIHPSIIDAIREIPLPGPIVQSSPVTTYPIQSILTSLVHGPGFQGINLLKIDVEGLDQGIVSDLLDYYELTLSRMELLPCVLSFETNYLSNFREEALMDRLRLVGYHLLHDFIVENDRPFYEDTVAINCRCSQIELLDACYFLAKFSTDVLTQVCSL